VTLLALQWGHVFSDVESVWQELFSITKRLASMGPRLFRRGKSKVMRAHRRNLVASMGPRLFRRGKNKTHGLSSTNLYKVWQGMKTRCTNRKAINFDNYGGRGISYDKQWEHFENFFQDMGYDYKEGLTLERKDNTKGYSKENCKWVTPKEQNENMRCNVYIAYQGDKLSAEVISKMTGLTRATIYHRHRKGWSGERIINTPPIPKTRRIT
jgi:hypothetical protein